MDRYPRDRQESFRPTSAEDLKRIIEDAASAELLVKEADRLGGALRQLTTSQIRSLFGEVRSIQAQWAQNPQRASRRLRLLQPKMAYRARKERGQAVGQLVSVLSPAIDLVGDDRERFERFVEFFEAILAYHKAHGGN